MVSAAVVPHHRRRMEADGVAAIVQPPAHVDVVAGDAEAVVETADREQRRRAGTPCCSRECARPRVSESSTWLGPPGECETHCAISPSVSADRRWGHRPRRAGGHEGVRPGSAASSDRDRRRRRCRRRSRPALRACPGCARAQAPVLGADQPHRRAPRGAGNARVGRRSRTNSARSPRWRRSSRRR